MLQLRPYEASDAEKIVGWLKDEVSFRQWCADRYEKYPITAEDMNEYYERYVREDNLYALTAVDEDGVVGSRQISAWWVRIRQRWRNRFKKRSGPYQR